MSDSRRQRTTSRNRHTILERRDFLRALGMTAGGLALTASAPAVSAVIRSASSASAIDAVFDQSIVFDALAMGDQWSDPAPLFRAYRQSGITAIHASLNTGGFQVAMAELAAWQGRFDRWPEQLLKIVRGSQLAEAKASGRLGVLLGFQNATIIETDVRNLEVLYAAGARCIQLTYNARNLLGDGCTERTDAGLSDFGVAVVERMNELGMVVDLSHCGETTSRDGIAMSRRPPVFTHTMCKSVHDHVRAKPDELLTALADKGGVIGIVTLGYFIGPTANTTLDDYLRHIDHAVNVAGIEHVALASDYSIFGIEATSTRESWYLSRQKIFKPEYNVRWPPWIAELDRPERFRNIAHGLHKRGYPAAHIEKILGGNWTRYLTDVLG
ncbi:dipeptidase [Steroidobacter sp.]|uniref:dipeptidase n=1 Tax=Steroidobacter sp. TaxID=1978227 RepID=UPI001A4F1748|nr:membrane dipeptidase [Steroidobacter sp.]MBL8269265.1 membrane dipeptidase [Steroidobacter sp.]